MDYDDRVRELLARGERLEAERAQLVKCGQRLAKLAAKFRRLKAEKDLLRGAWVGRHDQFRAEARDLLRQRDDEEREP